jgi:hypothetical protein
MPLAIWPDLKPVANILGGQEEKSSRAFPVCKP